MSNNTIAGYRLSAQQERVWSHWEGNPALYRAEAVVLLEGQLDALRLRNAFTEVVARHEILRTVFRRHAGVKVPFQVVQDEPVFSWRTADLSELDESAQRARMQELLHRSVDGYDPQHGPVLNVVLATLAPRKHTLLIGLPALCGDLRAISNLVAEVGRFYAAGAEDDALATEVMQYADMVEWQQQVLTSDDTRTGREFWRHYCRKVDFASSKSVLSPFETKREAPLAPNLVVTKIEASFASKIATFCSERNTSVEDLLLSCWQLLLARITGRPEITIGSEFDGRNYKELEDALGLFSKYLPLQFSFEPEMPFCAVLESVKNCAAEIRNWQESFAWNNLEIPAGLNHVPMPALAFDYAEYGREQVYGGVRFRIDRQEAWSERFELKLSARRREEEWKLEFHFDASRLERETVERWSRCFEALLAAAVQNPEMAVSRLPVLGESELRQLNEWNQTAAEYPGEQCVQALFEAQAARTPERAAVRCGEQQLSYRELNERSNQLARYLQGLGVGSDGLVGLCVEPGVGMLVGVLGILKAGGAYVPVSADHPPARLAQQLAGAVALVTEEKLLRKMPALAVPTVCLDRDRRRWSGEPVANPEARTQAGDLAYVIYTSGSTGMPKGVAVRHRNLVNYAHFIAERLETEKYAEGLQFATVSPLSADLGNTCLYGALVSGGCVHVIGPEVAVDSQRLRGYLAEHPVDVLKIVPSHLAAVLESGGGAGVLPRKYLVLGGETLTRRVVETIEELGAGCEIVNHYGPTETTVGSLTLRLRDYDWRRSAAHTIPIGRPIANTRVYILDAHGERVPVGVAGELYIAGAGVAAGYIGQPEQTAERFVPDVFGDDAGQKMYRTGDLARYGADGNVEFLGRGDDQVKIRGFRIELGEIAAVLGQHPTVQQAVVLAREEERGEKRLTAWVVGRRETPPAPEQLRAWLQTQLPQYMLPSAIVVLPRLPLTSNGKLDRQALPDSAASAQRPYAAPSTPTEEVVAAIWAEVLGRHPIGVDDDFFDIGGHSLLATQIVSRLRQRLHLELPVRALFEHPTVAKLAERIDHARRTEQGLLPPPLIQVPRDRALPLSFAQQRLWVLDQLEPNNPLYNIPRTLRMKGALDIESFRNALNEIIRRHESQRTTFAVRDGQPVQVIAPSLCIPLWLHDLTALPEAAREAEARNLAHEEALRPFDLATGPLIRAQLLRLRPDDHVLLLTVHHIISDAWSAGVFLQELCVLYRAFSERQPSPLPELPVQYADYAAWQRTWFQGDVLKKQLDYWRRQLKGAPPALNLRSDRPRPKTQSFRGAYKSVPVSRNLSSALKELSRRESTTLFMTLLAGFQLLLMRYSGQEHIVTGTDVANRPGPETERLIGFFINLLALHTDLSGNPRFRELLGRVREVALGAYTHQDMPFDRLVEELQPERSLSHNPLVQVLFVMQNIPRDRPELTGLELTPFEMPVTRSKFDLAVFMAEAGDELVGHWLYNIDLFDEATIDRMARHFEVLLRNAAAQPDARLSALEMFTEEDKLQREAERQQRKKSHLRQLMTIEVEEVGLSSSGRGSRE